MSHLSFKVKHLNVDELPLHASSVCDPGFPLRGTCSLKTSSLGPLQLAGAQACRRSWKMGACISDTWAVFKQYVMASRL